MRNKKNKKKDKNAEKENYKLLLAKLIKKIKNHKHKNKHGKKVYTFSTGKMEYGIRQKLHIIFYVLKNGISFKSINTENTILGYRIGCESTYRKFLQKIYKYNIIQSLFKTITNKYEKKHNSKKKYMYIDSTNILNKNGEVNLNNKISVLGNNTKHNGLKLNMIVNDDTIPISIELSDGKTHDVKMVLPLVNNIKLNTTDLHYLTGDKGYISSTLKTTLQQQNNIKYIYPPRNNQITVINQTENRLLKNRNKIERRFNFLFKSYKRIEHMNERKHKTYKAFIYLAIANTVINAI